MFQFCEQLIHHSGYSWGTILRSSQMSLLSVKAQCSYFTGLITILIFLLIYTTVLYHHVKLCLISSWLPVLIHKTTKFMEKENLCISCSLLLIQSIPRQIDKKSRVPKEEKGVWGPPSGDGVWNSQGRGKDKHFVSKFLKALVNYTTQIKLCTKDYITTMYPVWGQFLRQFLEDSPPSWKPSD